MNYLFRVALDLTLGLAIGAFFYGGLWWTVRRLSVKAAGLWLLGSFLMRAVIALAGFYAIARGTWYGTAACLAGFLAARVAVTRLTRIAPVASPACVPGSASQQRVPTASGVP
jgi:F1F0 ATPase subunit 2